MCTRSHADFGSQRFLRTTAHNHARYLFTRTESQESFNNFCGFGTFPNSPGVAIVLIRNGLSDSP
jgi:hypothetical protein